MSNTKDRVIRLEEREQVHSEWRTEIPNCGDPLCPCQDGDICHYVDDPVSGTKAFPPLTDEEKEEKRIVYLLAH